MENIFRPWTFLKGLFKVFFDHKIIIIDLSRDKKFRVGDFYDFSLGSVGLREPHIFFLALLQLYQPSLFYPTVVHFFYKKPEFPG